MNLQIVGMHIHSKKSFLEFSSTTFSQPPTMTKLKIAAYLLLCLSAKSSFADEAQTLPQTLENYLQEREAIIKSDTNLILGMSLELRDPREITVNNILMYFKDKEFDLGLNSNGKYFPAAHHFFLGKSKIDKSDVYKIIRMFPKGAALHLHESTAGDVNYVTLNLTRWDNLYYCTNSNGHLLFRFFESEPEVECSPGLKWGNVAYLRKTETDQWIDSWFLSRMSMITPSPMVTYVDTNAAWSHFEKKITTINGVIFYEKAMRNNYYNVLKDHYDDNVMYLEMRGILSGAYHLNQTQLSTLEALKMYKETTDKFLHDYPNFWGGKYIYAPHRFHKAEVIQEMINAAIKMKKTLPDYFIGFDLVGQEDVGAPLLDFLPQLLYAASHGVKFFFHSGETAWRGSKIDENLVDAVLLNTTRFAHSYALSSHPYIYELAKAKGIAAEVCPISNQILRLVDDLRNHPAKNYLLDGFPVVIASDGPGMWGATPMSHDWYMTFMGIAGKRADLRFLKQLAINSIRYSAMSQDEKDRAFDKWKVQWEQFLEKVIQKYNNYITNTTIKINS